MIEGYKLFDIVVAICTNVNILRPKQNGCHFAGDIFKHIFLNENVWIAIKISLKFVSEGLTNIIPALVQRMFSRLTGDKPSPDQWCLDYRRICHSDSMSK